MGNTSISPKEALNELVETMDLLMKYGGSVNFRLKQSIGKSSPVTIYTLNTEIDTYNPLVHETIDTQKNPDFLSPLGFRARKIVEFPWPD